MSGRPASSGGRADRPARLTTQGRERKRQLVDCAARLFAERGYEETRILDIVDAAGVAKGLFYWYFDTKEALFEEVAASIRRRLRQHQAAAIDPAADPLTQVVQGAEASVRFMSEHAQFFSLLEAETGASTQQVRRRGTQQHVDDVQRLVEEGQALGLVVDEDPALLAYGLVGMVGLHSHLHRTGRSTHSVDELAAHVGRAARRSLESHGARAHRFDEVAGVAGN